MATRNLTKAAIESLAYDSNGPSRQVLWDAKIRGFGCRVTPQGGKQYVLLYRASGRQRLMSLGRIEDFQSLDQARTKASGFLHGLRHENVDPMAARERLADAECMRELWAVYERDHIAHKSVNTQRAVSSVWTVHIEPVIGSLNPGQVGKADVIRVHDKATEKGGKIVANRAVQHLRTMLTWLFDRNERQFPIGWRNPTAKVKLHKEPPRRAILDLAQQRVLVAALAEEPDPWVRVYIQLLMLTGCRANELLSLKWQDVNYDKATALISRSGAATEARKNGLDLLVPLPPGALTLLRSLPVVAGSDFVFPSPRKPGQAYTSNAIRRRYEAALERAGLPHRTLHDLRRSMGTNIARTGASTKQIAQLLGNTDEVTARVYVQLAADDLRRLTEANASSILPAPQT